MQMNAYSLNVPVNDTTELFYAGGMYSTYSENVSTIMKSTSINDIKVLF